MQAAKEAFDLRIQAARHPWIFVGGAVILGYGISALYHRGWRITSGVVPYYPLGAKAAPVMPKNGSASSREDDPEVYPFYPSSHEAGSVGRVQDHAKRPTVLGELEKALHDELGVVRNSVVRFGRGLIHEMVRQSVPALVQIIAGSRRERNHRSASDHPH